jgi:cytosine/adenosine deaminase-related metal-dependent hydrolase
MSRVLIEAAGLADARGNETRPGQPGRLLVDISGDQPAVLDVPAGDAPRHSLPDAVILPALVNAHTHLDLTHVGPRPYDPGGGFVGWVDMVRAERADADVREAVRRGVELSLAGGVVCVGDIAGVRSTIPVEVLRDSPLSGVSFVEFFGTGGAQDEVCGHITALRDDVELRASGIRLGVQPHAPYSAGRRVYQHACGTGLPVATHLAETPEEREFVRDAQGPLRTLLERLGVWDPAILEEIGMGLAPVEHIAGIVGRHPVLAAHVNDCDDRALDLLATSNITVAYCPRASDYFGHHDVFGPHRYREMMDRGIRVVLGTDSIINLPPGTDRISTLDEMRFLHRRDGTPAADLLRMGTTDAAAALGEAPDRFSLVPGPVAGLVSVDVAGTHPRLSPSDRVMQSDAAPMLLAMESLGGP